MQKSPKRRPKPAQKIKLARIEFEIFINNKSKYQT